MSAAKGSMDRAGGVPNVEKSVEELNNAQEEYREKWEILKKENTEVFMKVDLALEQKVTTSGGFGAGPNRSGSGISSSDSLTLFPRGGEGI